MRMFDDSELSDSSTMDREPTLTPAKSCQILPPIESRPSTSKSPKAAHNWNAAGRPSSSRRRSQSPLPIAHFDIRKLRSEHKKAKRTHNCETLVSYYNTAFSSYQAIDTAFAVRKKRSSSSSTLDGQIETDPFGSGLDLPLLWEAYDLMLQADGQVHRVMLKAVINALLTDQRHQDSVLSHRVPAIELRAFFALLQNPQFERIATFVMFAHLLRAVATLCPADRTTLALWLSALPKKRLTACVASIQQLISIRLFPPRPQDLPPMQSCLWWIPCAVRCLAVFESANRQSSLVGLDVFYNGSLDHWDLLADLNHWLNVHKHAQQSRAELIRTFSFCAYPFILSLTAKRSLLDAYAEQQMIQQARDAIIGNLMDLRMPDPDMVFVNVHVRRDHLLHDSLRELTTKQAHLRKKLRVHFVGEPGLDMGGLTKEWFQLLVKTVFDPKYGMFTYHKAAGAFWLAAGSGGGVADTLQEFRLVGTVLGLAMYNGVILNVRLASVVYDKLLSPAQLPDDGRSQELGVLQATLDHVRTIDRTIADSLEQVLAYEGDVREDLALNFAVDQTRFGGSSQVELKPGGAHIDVDNDNKEEYVQLYIDWLVNRSVQAEFSAFHLGFHSVVGSCVMQLLRAEEVELLVCGSDRFELAQLKRVAKYDGYSASDRTIRHFWSVVDRLSERRQRRLLHFVTGSDRVPAEGLHNFVFVVARAVASDPQHSIQHLLPMAHTCFNRLLLPDYQCRRTLKQRLNLALDNGEGFGLQ